MIAKTLLLLSAVLIFLQAGDNSSVKITSWTFYFAKTPFMSGGENDPPGPRELEVKPNRELMIAVTYEGQPPSVSTLQVRTAQGVQREYQHEVQESRDAFTPTVNLGSQFVVPVSDLIADADAGPIEAEFYYSDANGISDLKLGTITLKW